MTTQGLGFTQTQMAWEQRCNKEKGIQDKFKKLLYSSMDAGKSGQSWFTDATQASVPYAPYTRVNQDHKKMKQLNGLFLDSTCLNVSDPNSMRDQGPLRNAQYNFNMKIMPKTASAAYRSQRSTRSRVSREWQSDFNDHKLNNTLYSYGGTSAIRHSNVHRVSGQAIDDQRKSEGPILVKVNDYTKNISQSIFSPGMKVRQTRNSDFSSGKKTSKRSMRVRSSVKVSQLIDQLKSEHLRKDYLKQEIRVILNKLILNMSAKNKQLSFELLIKKPIFLRLDVLSTPLTIGSVLFNFGYHVFDTDQFLPITIFCFTCLFQAIFYLMNFWSTKAHAWIAYRGSKDVNTSTHVMVTLVNLKQHSTKRYIVPLLRQALKVDKDTYTKVNTVEFNKKRFLYTPDKKTFNAIPFPITSTIEEYQFAEGILTENEIQKAQLVWGRNKLDIPIPTFFDVYKEHLVAPFFIFQIFCNILWMLDDYWYYSLMSFSMIFMFEGTVVMQRLQNMKRLRSMRVPAQELWVHRMNRWIKLSSDEIFPGEIVLLKKNRDLKVDLIPCDLLLISGSAVVNEAILTGESQPLVKESISSKDDPEEVLNLKGEHRVHILNGGTEILQHIPSEEPKEFEHLDKLPCEGIICFVLKNGFETKQGKLMRTILFSTERVSVESKETYYFLSILLVFAIVACNYVVQETLKDPDRSRYKLILRCIMILTNVVPPELPMELSMAVNYSILQLVQKSVYCTEPFRIPDAGKVSVCCFDKTGTLTKNDLVIRGVTQIGGNQSDQVVPLAEIHNKDRNALMVLGGCHTIAMADGQLIGDPIEKQSFEQIGWKHDGRRSSNGNHIKLIQVKRFLFESALKRMSVVAAVEEQGQLKEHRVLVKGAPETLKSFMNNPPASYDKGYLSYTKKGARVLALAYKTLPKMQNYAELTRADVEKDLTFCGFIISECPLKPDTLKVITQLKNASHEIKMITGDNHLTAAFIGRELGFGPVGKPSLFLRECPKAGTLVWDDIDEKEAATTKSVPEIEKLCKQFVLCVTGPVLEELHQKYKKDAHDDMHATISAFHIYARTSPNQKDFIVGQINKTGMITLMCGDGTNDVGSLKRSHVGLAIINKPEPTKEQRKKFTGISSMWLPKDKQVGLNRQQIMEAQQKHMEEWKKLNSMETDPSGMPELGDACMAAPFTYKFSSIRAVKKLIQQGRTTLVTTFQMYKILSLNSLISAYTMSVLHLKGVKLGDYQYTCIGLAISIMFMMISFSKPLSTLEKAKPPTSIFHWSLIISVLGQFIVHFTALLYLISICEKFVDYNDESLIPDGEFKASVMNTIIFYYQFWLQCSVIFVNYQGRPFTQDLTENGKLFKFILALFALAIACILDFSDTLRETLELVSFPDQTTQQQVIITLVLDLALCYIIEKSVKRAYLKQFD